MQAQASRTEQHQAVITSQQSLQSIQTLLRAGLGCITYLRNLLPSDNFSESYLTSSGPDTLSSQPSQSGSSFASSDGRRNVSGFKIMTVTRGFTEEADRLLDYLENGIFDALSKQYLRSLIFAIYLDDQDPNNIIEAYTFNFKYCEVPGTTEAVPIMTLGEEMMNLNLSGSTATKTHDPVAEATKKGKVPTLGEVKRSLKTLIKNLIQATTQMDALPKRRFATFKLFYYDHTPDDYEPPHFRAGDVNKDKWFMTTHAQGEVPERCSVGFVHTGYHGVDVKVASVSGYLPSCEDNNAPFLGTMDRSIFAAPPLTPTEEAAQRAQQIKAQRQDAVKRCVVWDGDDGLGDADVGGDLPADRNGPIGMRDHDGSIIPYTSGTERPNFGPSAEAQYAGQPETMPSCIGQLAKGAPLPCQEVSPTQELESTQVIQSPTATAPASPTRSPTPTPKPRNLRLRGTARTDSPLPPSDVPSLSSGSEPPQDPGTIDTQMMYDMMADTSPDDDSMMLDTETQPAPLFPHVEDAIEPSSELAQVVGPETPMIMDEGRGSLDCECGVQSEDCDLCICEGGCRRWFHLWCMGYHSAKDPRIPSRFICFDCRVKADRNWDLIVVHDLYPRMIARFKDLAIQRRGIKVFEAHAPDGLSAFTKLIGCDSTVAGQVFKRLEAEGFIAQETREEDDSGFLETTALATKRKGRGGKTNRKTRASQRRKNLQKPVYIFVQAIKNEVTYKDYFNPDPEVEKRLLGLSDLKPARKSRKKMAEEHPATEANTSPAQLDTATGLDNVTADSGLADTQPLPTAFESQIQEAQLLDAHRQLGQLKRKTGVVEDGRGKGKKKIKMSLGPPVDLGD
ncbi:HORMA domain-containing protein [Daedaleopsis nitida]|nr:HORMA domain-containing protein [Daedaleopsis nitida]